MERLSPHQFLVLSAAVLLGLTYLSVGSLIGEAGRDGWMIIFPAFIWAVPFGLMILSLMAKYPGEDLIKISERVVGKGLSKGIGIIYIILVTYYGSLLAGLEVDIFNRTVLPLMPRYVFLLGGGFLTFYLFYSGIEVLGRFAEVVFPIVTMGLILMIIFIIPRFEEGELFPILADGIRPVLSSSGKIVHFSMEYILFLAGLLPFLPSKANDIKNLKQKLLTAVFLVIILDTLIVLIQILTFGPFETTRMSFGLLALGKMIEISRTLAGVESIFNLFWLGGSTIKVASYFFAVMWAIKSVFGFKNRKWSFLLGFISFIIIQYAARGLEISTELSFVGRYFLVPFTVLWVLVIWGVDKWKNRSQNG